MSFENSQETQTYFYFTEVFFSAMSTAATCIVTCAAGCILQFYFKT